MEEATQPAARRNRLGIALGVTSLLASIASLYAFSRYGHWHQELRGVLMARGRPPEWLTWGVVDSYKTASVVLACVAMPLAVISAFRRAQLLATFALLLALLALLTIPIVT